MFVYHYNNKIYDKIYSKKAILKQVKLSNKMNLLLSTKDLPEQKGSFGWAEMRSQQSASKRVDYCKFIGNLLEIYWKFIGNLMKTHSKCVANTMNFFSRTATLSSKICHNLYIRSFHFACICIKVHICNCLSFNYCHLFVCFLC